MVRYGSHRLSLVLSILLVTVAAVSQVRAQWERDYPNLIYNGSFERPDWLNRDRTEFWQQRSEMRRDTSVKHSGVVSLCIQGPVTGYTFQKHVNLISDTDYVLNAWIRTPDVRGKGLSLFYGQLKPSGKTLVQTKPVADAADWTKIEAAFRTPSDTVSGWVRLVWDLKDGDVAWFDDVTLQPASEQVPTASEPQLTPSGGTHEGPVHVSMSTDLAGATIRYTTDGSDPTPFSTEYTAPVRLSGTVVIKARAFHAGHRPSPVAEAKFDLKPQTGPGVPFSPVAWDQNVEAWWSGCIYNPQSPVAVAASIESPVPRIDVAAVRERHPESKTAGIEEALAMLPATGGTLWFPKERGPYVIRKPPQTVRNYYVLAGPIMVLRRSNIHFLSDGAEICFDGSTPWEDVAPSGNVGGMCTFCSMESTDQGIMQNPATNFYFKDLVFDGGGKAVGALVFRHCAEVLMDGCVFRNFDPQAEGHPGAVSAASCADDIWIRNCRFESGKYGIYWDGVHGGGILDSEFLPDLAATPVLIFTNNDMSPLSGFQRSGQYVVIDGCTFQGGGRSRATMAMTVANTLVSNNRVTGPFREFVQHRGRGQSNIMRHLRYDGSGIHIRDNHVENVRTVVALLADVSQQTRRELFDMKNVIQNNVARDVDVLLSMDPGVHHDSVARYADPQYARIENVLMTGNRLSGQFLPQVRVNRENLSRIQDIVITDNTLTGKQRPLLVDLGGKPVDSRQIRILDNRIEPVR